MVNQGIKKVIQVETSKRGVRSSPTSYYWQPYSGIEGYELKERATLRVTGSHIYRRSGDQSCYEVQCEHTGLINPSSNPARISRKATLPNSV